jgi:hypothetical protein
VNPITLSFIHRESEYSLSRSVRYVRCRTLPEGKIPKGNAQAFAEKESLTLGLRCYHQTRAAPGQRDRKNRGQ